jgi:hypothetical protein
VEVPKHALPDTVSRKLTTRVGSRIMLAELCK